jgi:hypothetical protein
MDRDPPPPNGLCDSCAHQKLVSNTRGSVFTLCLLSRTDSRFPRYPRTPVVSCEGYREAGAAAAGGGRG